MPARNSHNVPLDSRGKPYRPGGPISAQKTTIERGTRLKVYWPGMKRFYSGTVASVEERGLYTINYDDGEVLKVRLGNVIWDYQQPKVRSSKTSMDKKESMQVTLAGAKRKRATHGGDSQRQNGSESVAKPVESNGFRKKRKEERGKPVQTSGRKAQKREAAAAAGFTNETDLGKRVRKPSVLLREILGGTMVGSEAMDGYALAAADLLSGDAPPGKTKQVKRQTPEVHLGSKQPELYPPLMRNDSGSLSKDGSISGRNLPFLTSPTDISSRPSPQSPEPSPTPFNQHNRQRDRAQGPVSPNEEIAVDLSTPAHSPRLEDHLHLRAGPGGKPTLQMLHRRKGIPAKATLPEAEQSISPAARPPPPRKPTQSEKSDESDSLWTGEEEEPRWEGAQRRKRKPPTVGLQRRKQRTKANSVPPPAPPCAVKGNSVGPRKSQKTQLMEKSQKTEIAEKSQKTHLAETSQKTHSVKKTQKTQVAEKTHKTQVAKKSQKTHFAEKARSIQKTQLVEKAQKTQRTQVEAKGQKTQPQAAAGKGENRVPGEEDSRGLRPLVDVYQRCLGQQAASEQGGGSSFWEPAHSGGGGEEIMQKTKEGGGSVGSPPPPQRRAAEQDGTGSSPKWLAQLLLQMQTEEEEGTEGMVEGGELKAESGERGGEKGPCVGGHAGQVEGEGGNALVEVKEPLSLERVTRWAPAGLDGNGNGASLAPAETKCAGSVLGQPSIVVDCTGVVLDSNSKLIAGNQRPEDILLHKLREVPLKQARALHSIEVAGGLTAWLDRLGLQRAKELFSAAGLGAAQVVMLTRNDLRRLGLVVGSQVRIMAALRDLFQDS